MHTLLAVTTTDTAASGGAAAGSLIAGLIGYVIAVLPIYFIFTKAGEAGWQALIPIWNTIVLLKISGKPVWWIVLFLIPIVNIVFLILTYHGLSVSFGHGAGFTVGLVLLPVIFFYILWLDGSTYRGPGGTGASAQPAGAYA